MEVDSLKQTGSVRPGSKRTHTGELATAHTPHSPDPPHNMVESLVSQVFKVAFTVSTITSLVRPPALIVVWTSAQKHWVWVRSLVHMKWCLVIKCIGVLLHQSDCLKHHQRQPASKFVGLAVLYWSLLDNATGQT